MRLEEPGLEAGHDRDFDYYYVFVCLRVIQDQEVGCNLC